MENRNDRKPDDELGKELSKGPMQSEPNAQRLMNLEALIINSFKQFVGKDNKMRHQKHAKEQDYAKYNLGVVVREFIGHKFYSLLVDTPKTYITCAENGDLGIQSEKKSGAKTLNQYLCEAINSKFPGLDYKQIQDVDFLNADIKAALKEALNNLKGIGVLCFMALWLQDFDVFGEKLDNVLVIDGKVSKIDTSEIRFDRYTKDFDDGICALFPNNKDEKRAYLSHVQMPFFTTIVDLLDEKQIQEGVSAISSLPDPKLKPSVQQITNYVGIDDNNSGEIYDVLRARRNAILFNVGGNYFANKTTVDLRDIGQQVIIRPASDFEATEEKIKGGNSNPTVTQKTRSEKKDKRNILLCAYSIIESMILLLSKEANKLEMGENKALLITAVENLKVLLNSLNKKLNDRLPNGKYRNYTLAELTKVSNEFNQIVDQQVYPALDISTREKIINSILSVFKKEEPKEVKVKDKKDLTTKDEVDQLTEFFKNKYAGFFQKVISFTDNAGAKVNDSEFKQNKNSKS